MKLYLIDRPIADRRADRRKGDRRWIGPDGDRPSASHDPRRKGDRRKKKRRD